MESAGQPTISPHELQGRAWLRRVGRVRFPVLELTQGETIHASLGRAGWTRIFFGRGQRIDLPDGSRWRLGSLGGGGAICPAIVDDQKRRIAVASLREGGYGINGKEYGFFLYPTDKNRLSRSNRWILRRYDDEVATVFRYPLSIETTEPVHVGAVLLAFTLVRHGIVGESRPRLKLEWG